MPRFVVLHHDWPTPHFDFMVESDGALWTWRWDVWPESGGEFQAERIADHRLAYLDYEGPVSRNRGTVVRVDRGECEIISIDAKHLTLVLSGAKMSGRMVIADPISAMCSCRWEVNAAGPGDSG